MTILDENISVPQRELLDGWGIRTRHIGHDIGRSGMGDDEIIPFLHRHDGATFFTRDRDFFRPELCHAGYCLVCLFVEERQTAVLIRRALRHPALGTRADRLGSVIGAWPGRLQAWRLHAAGKIQLDWPEY